jgi:hypothetical protein
MSERETCASDAVVATYSALSSFDAPAVVFVLSVIVVNSYICILCQANKKSIEFESGREHFSSATTSIQKLSSQQVIDPRSFRTIAPEMSVFTIKDSVIIDRAGGHR